MIPGEMDVEEGEIELNQGRETVTLEVANSGDRPIQVGSHYHFYETNTSLVFERERTRGYRLDIPAGTAVRFEPGQKREVRLVAYAGDRVESCFRILCPYPDVNPIVLHMDSTIQRLHGCMGQVRNMIIGFNRLLGIVHQVDDVAFFLQDRSFFLELAKKFLFEGIRKSFTTSSASS